MVSENERFREARLKVGLTLHELAGKIGYSVGAISGVENSHDQPSKRLRQRLVEALGLDEDWLRSGQGEMFKKRSQVVSVYEWLADPRDKQWDKLSDEEKNERALKYFKGAYESAKLTVTSQDEERGWLEVALDYRGQKPPSGYPSKLRLARPSPIRCKELLAETVNVIDFSHILFACLPEELRNWTFIDKLTIFCFMAMERAAMILCFGHNFWDALADAVADRPLPAELQRAKAVVGTVLAARRKAKGKK